MRKVLVLIVFLVLLQPTIHAQFGRQPQSRYVELTKQSATPSNARPGKMRFFITTGNVTKWVDESGAVVTMAANGPAGSFTTVTASGTATANGLGIRTTGINALGSGDSANNGELVSIDATATGASGIGVKIHDTNSYYPFFTLDQNNIYGWIFYNDASGFQMGRAIGGDFTRVIKIDHAPGSNPTLRIRNNGTDYKVPVKAATFIPNYVEVSGAGYTVLASDHFIAINPAGADRTVNLIAVASMTAGQKVVIKNIGTANNVIVHTNGGTEEIDDSAGDRTLTPKQSITLVDGTDEWWVE